MIVTNKSIYLSNKKKSKADEIFSVLTFLLEYERYCSDLHRILHIITCTT